MVTGTNKPGLKYVQGWAFPEIDGYISERITPEGLYQADALEAGVGLCRKFRTAIDGGAHVGTWTVRLAALFERVCAFEPAGDTFAALCKNVDQFAPAKPTGGAELILYNQALGATPGRVKMALAEKYAAMGHTGARYAVDGGTIRRVTIDSLGLPDLDFLKLDLEGGETDALYGAEATLLRCKPVVVFEDKRFGKRYGYSRDEPKQFLTELGASEIKKVGINAIWAWFDEN